VALADGRLILGVLRRHQHSGPEQHQHQHQGRQDWLECAPSGAADSCPKWTWRERPGARAKLTPCRGGQWRRCNHDHDC
jgi:hypothetical protein